MFPRDFKIWSVTLVAYCPPPTSPPQVHQAPGWRAGHRVDVLSGGVGGPCAPAPAAPCGAGSRRPASPSPVPRVASGACPADHSLRGLQRTLGTSDDPSRLRRITLSGGLSCRRHSFLLWLIPLCITLAAAVNLSSVSLDRSSRVLFFYRPSTPLKRPSAKGPRGFRRIILSVSGGGVGRSCSFCGAQLT